MTTPRSAGAVHCPYPFEPQHTTDPSGRTASEWAMPPSMPVTALSEAGTEDWPNSFQPQHTTVPHAEVKCRCRAPVPRPHRASCSRIPGGPEADQIHGPVRLILPSVGRANAARDGVPANSVGPPPPRSTRCEPDAGPTGLIARPDGILAMASVLFADALHSNRSAGTACRKISSVAYQ